MKNIKRNVGAIAGAVTITMLLAACGANASADSGGTLTVKVADTSDPGSSLNDVLNKYFAKDLSQETGKKLALQVFPSGQLGDEVTLMKKLQAGSLDMAVVGVTNVKGLDALYTPWFFSGWNQIEQTLDRGYLKRQFDQLKQRNTVYIGWLYRSPREITSNKPIKSPADLAGLKIRAPQFPGMIKVFSSLNANVVALPFPEVFTSLQSGVVDAQENPVAITNSSKFYEVQKYLDMTNHSYAPYLAFVSQQFWSKLSADQQTQFRKAWKQAQAQSVSYVNKAVQQNIAQLKTHGMQVVQSDDQAFLARAKPVAEQYLTQVWGPDTVAKIENIAPKG
jgi:tripartite ATP-independent transporter DctP family solute receptor